MRRHRIRALAGAGFDQVLPTVALSRDCAEPAGIALCGNRAEYDLARQHRLYRDRRRVVASGSRTRAGNPQDSRRGDARSYADRTAACGHDDDCSAGKAWSRSHLSLRSRVAVRGRRLCRPFGCDRRGALDEHHRELLRDGELLPHLQD